MTECGPFFILFRVFQNAANAPRNRLGVIRDIKCPTVVCSSFSTLPFLPSKKMKLAVLAALVSGAAAQLMINTPYAPQLLPALSTQLDIPQHQRAHCWRTYVLAYSKSFPVLTARCAAECQPVLISWTGGEGTSPLEYRKYSH
jgi:hypothetical protein